MHIILASASPRRKELLQKLFPVFDIIPSRSEEICTKTSPKDIVLELSEQKAEEIRQTFKNTDNYLIIGADTVVSWKGKVLGKPRNEQDAKRMLAMLSDDTHQVYTGVTLLYSKSGRKERLQFAECTHVKFYPLLEAEIDAYVKSGEPMDKAGSYGIQGAGGRFVEKIEGDYQNVVGLPVAKIYQVLKKIDDFALPF